MNIDARELTLLFDGDKDTMTVAVDNVDLSVRQNEMLGIMGPSGSGKSSLLNLLSGLRKPSSGSVFYDGEDILSLSEKEMDIIRSERFGFIFQRHYLISHLTILENILLPLKIISKQHTDYALDLMSELDVWKYRDKRPNEISVGERQKAAVLRALINNPQILFADEPTASLDIESAIKVMDLLVKRVKTAGIIVVTHDFRILKNADRIVHMQDGKL